MKYSLKRTFLWVVFLIWTKKISGMDSTSNYVRLTGPSPVPLHHNGSFTCQTLQSGSKPAWRLEYPNNNEPASNILPFYPECRGVCVANQNRNIYYTFDNTIYASTLTIRGTEANNGTMVTCIEHTMATGMDRETKMFSVYGPPPPPATINISHHDLTTLNVSWSAAYSAFNVTTTYKFVAQVEGGIQNTLGTNISNRYYLYSLPPICKKMIYSVYSLNPAGQSRHSIKNQSYSYIITNLKNVSNSISHSVSKHANGTELTLQMEHLPRFCPHYSQTKVNILLTSLTPLSSSQIKILNLNALPVKVELKDNAIYRYSLFVLDNLTIYASDQNIYTTDVIPPVKICVDKDKRIAEVHCKIHEQSKARGCVVYINNNPHYVERKDTMASSRLNLPDVEFAQVNITVVDWNENGPRQALNIPIQIIPEVLPITTAPPSHGNLVPSGPISTSTRTMIAGIVLGCIALIVVVAVVAAIIIATIIYHVKPRRKKQRGVQGLQNGVRASDKFCTSSCLSLTPSPSPSPATMYTMIQGSSLTAMNYAPTASSTHSTASHFPPSPVIYPSLSASLARDASPPTPASTAALHVHFSLNPNRDDSPFATYDVPSHSPPLPASLYQDPKTYAQQASYALYDQLPQSANNSPSFQPVEVPSPVAPTSQSSIPPAVPPPPPLPYRGRLSSTPESVIRDPSPEYVAMSHPDEQTCINSIHSKSPVHKDFSSALSFTSSNFLTKHKSHDPSAT